MNDKNNSLISQELLDQAMDYESYTKLLDQLFEEGKTTGNNHSEAMMNYAKLNIQRMKRISKTLSITAQLEDAVRNYTGQPMIWLVLTEGWCGDAAQNLPLIHAIECLSDKINLKLILRDEHLDIMDEFLTNGGRSIPKLIALNEESLQVMWTWGPRPKEAQNMVMEFKKQENGDYQEFVKSMQLWYAKDKTHTLQQEFVELIS